MSESLETIVSELVEVRYRKLIEQIVRQGTQTGYDYHDSSLDCILKTKVVEIMEQEVGKKEDEIRKMVRERVATEVSDMEIINTIEIKRSMR